MKPIPCNGIHNRIFAMVLVYTLKPLFILRLYIHSDALARTSPYIIQADIHRDVCIIHIIQADIHRATGIDRGAPCR